MRKINYETGKEFADANGMMFFETSALKNKNTNKVIQSLIQKAHEIKSELNYDNESDISDVKIKKNNCCSIFD